MPRKLSNNPSTAHLREMMRRHRFSQRRTVLTDQRIPPVIRLIIAIIALFTAILVYAFKHGLYR